MNVVFVRKSNYISYTYEVLNGYTFKPKRNISNLVIVDKNLIRIILSKKIKKNIKKLTKTINLIINSNVAIVSDCDMMRDEIFKLIKKTEKKYMKYFSEFEYFDLIKELYQLNMEINLKKSILENE